MNKTLSPARPRYEAGKRSAARVFYGWWIIAACVVMMLLISGIGFSGLGIFLPSLEQEFQASTAWVSLCATVFFLVFGLIGPYAGRQVDRRGARPVMLIGTILFCAGLAGLAVARTLSHTYLAYVVMAAGFSATSLIAVGALVSSWFRVRRGLAMGLVMAGFSLGGVVMPPVITQLILLAGWRIAALALALLVMVVNVPLVMFVVKSRPVDLHLLPDGEVQQARLPTTASASVSTGRDWTLTKALRTRPFWALAVGYLLAYTAQVGVLIHQMRFLTYGPPEAGALAPAVAALAVSLTSVASMTGRFLLGTVIDRLSRRRVAAAMIAFQSIATLCLLLARGNLLLMLLAVVAFGLVMGSVLMLHSLLVADLFGIHAFGAIYGATLTLGTLGMAGGPWLAGVLFAASGSYDIAFSTFAAAGLLGALLVASAAPTPVG